MAHGIKVGDSVHIPFVNKTGVVINVIPKEKTRGLFVSGKYDSLLIEFVDGTSQSWSARDVEKVASNGAVAPGGPAPEDKQPDRPRHASPIKIVIFKHKNNPRLVITVKAYPSMSIAEIDNPQNVRFPYVVGQTLNMGHRTWACNNGYLVNDEDPCPEKKIFGMRAKDIPQGHPLRHLYPGKFRADGAGIKAARGLKISTLREELKHYNTRIEELEAELKDPEISDYRRTEIEVNLLPDLEQGRHINLSTLRGILRRRFWSTGKVAQGDSPLMNSKEDMPVHGKGYTNGGGVEDGIKKDASTLSSYFKDINEANGDQDQVVVRKLKDNSGIRIYTNNWTESDNENSVNAIHWGKDSANLMSKEQLIQHISNINSKVVTIATYAELLDLKNKNNLIKNKIYLVTDKQSFYESSERGLNGPIEADVNSINLEEYHIVMEDIVTGYGEEDEGEEEERKVARTFTLKSKSNK